MIPSSLSVLLDSSEFPGYYSIQADDGRKRRREGRTLVWNLYADFLVDWERNCAEDDCGQCNHQLDIILAATIRP